MQTFTTRIQVALNWDKQYPESKFFCKIKVYCQLILHRAYNQQFHMWNKNIVVHTIQQYVMNGYNSESDSLITLL